MSKKINCVEMKLKIQKNLYKKTQNMSEKDTVKYLEGIALSGRFGHLFKKTAKQKKKTTKEAA